MKISVLIREKKKKEKERADTGSSLGPVTLCVFDYVWLRTRVVTSRTNQPISPFAHRPSVYASSLPLSPHLLPFTLSRLVARANYTRRSQCRATTQLLRRLNGDWILVIGIDRASLTFGTRTNKRAKEWSFLGRSAFGTVEIHSRTRRINRRVKFYLLLATKREEEGGRGRASSLGYQILILDRYISRIYTGRLLLGRVIIFRLTLGISDIIESFCLRSVAKVTK